MTFEQAKEKARSLALRDGRIRFLYQSNINGWCIALTKKRDCIAVNSFSSRYVVNGQYADYIL